MSHLPETKPAESEVPIERATSTAIPATIPETGREFEALAHLCNSCYSSHEISLRRGAGHLDGGR